MDNIENHSSFIEGKYIVQRNAAHIKNSVYGTFEKAIQTKLELIDELKKNLGWDDTNVDVIYIRGMIAGWQEEIDNKKGDTHLSLTDIKVVANSIDKDVSTDEMKEVLKRYPDAQKQDDSATWNLVVEQLIYDVMKESKMS